MNVGARKGEVNYEPSTVAELSQSLAQATHADLGRVQAAAARLNDN